MKTYLSICVLSLTSLHITSVKQKSLKKILQASTVKEQGMFANGQHKLDLQYPDLLEGKYFST